MNLPNSDSVAEPPVASHTSPSVGKERVVTDADVEYDDMEDKEPIAIGDPSSPVDKVDDAIRDSESEDDVMMNDTTESFRRSHRTRWPSSRYKDFEVELPLSLMIEAVNSIMEPQTLEEALAAPDADQWIQALKKEYGDLMRNNTWELVERPKGKKVLTSRWVFVRKRDAHGNYVRHRARITIKGCQQRYGVNFWETYSPVVAQEAVKFILLLALHLGLSCRHVDFVTAFLNGPIGDVDIYMEMPEYFDDGSDRVCKLLRSLYGLKQAPMIWYQTLDKYLRSLGFRRSKMDGGI